jgi:hypothetical protein
MKLGSILALVSSSFAIKATDADTSFLRKVTKVANGSGLAGRDKVNYGDESGFAGVAIFMDGVTGHDGSSDDIVSNCLVNAFNTVHKKANDDYELSDAFVAKSFVVPSPNSTLTDENDVLVASNPGDGDIRATQTKKKKNQGSTYWWLETGYHCRLCNPDNLLSQEAFFENFVAKNNGNMHKALKKEFRRELLASGSEVFASIGSCEISFLRPAITTTNTVASATSSSFDATKEDGMARLTNVDRRGEHQEDLVTETASVTKE